MYRIDVLKQMGCQKRELVAPYLDAGDIPLAAFGIFKTMKDIPQATHVVRPLRNNRMLQTLICNICAHRPLLGCW